MLSSAGSAHCDWHPASAALAGKALTPKTVTLIFNTYNQHAQSCRTSRTGCTSKWGNSSRTPGVRSLPVPVRHPSAIIDLSRTKSQDLSLFCWGLFPKADEPCPVVEKPQHLLVLSAYKTQVVPLVALKGQHHGLGQTRPIMKHVYSWKCFSLAGKVFSCGSYISSSCTEQ